MDQRKLLFQWQVPRIFLSEGAVAAKGAHASAVSPCPSALTASGRIRAWPGRGCCGTDGRTDGRGAAPCRQMVLGLHASRCSPASLLPPAASEDTRRAIPASPGSLEPGGTLWERGHHSILSTGGCCVLRLPSLPGVGGPAVSP